MRKVLFLLMILVIFSNFAWAEDLVATWDLKNGKPMKVAYRDDTHVRIDTSNEAYMLLTGDKVYMVNRENEQWQAFDMDEMAGMMKAFGNAAPGAQDMEAKMGNAELKDTGRTEKVAGYKGKIYLVEEEQDDGSMKPVELVLSTHRDIKKINRGWLALSTRMGKMMGQDMAQSIEQAANESQKKGYGGMLRHSDNIKLQKVQKENLPASYFKLPEGVTLLNMPKFSMDDAQKAVPQRPAVKEPAQQNTQTTASDQDTTEDEIKKEIDKGVRNLLKKLF